MELIFDQKGRVSLKVWNDKDEILYEERDIFLKAEVYLRPQKQ